MPNLKLTYEHSLALATTVVGFLVALIPSFAPYTQHLIMGASVLLSVVIILGDAIKNRAKGESVATASLDSVKTALSQLDLNSIVKDELAKIAVSNTQPIPVQPPAPTPTQ